MLGSLSQLDLALLRQSSATFLPTSKGNESLFRVTGPTITNDSDRAGRVCLTPTSFLLSRLCDCDPPWLRNRVTWASLPHLDLSTALLYLGLHTPFIMSFSDASSAPVSSPSASLHLLVIGAGLCGLGAAISTALEGHKVTIFEAAPQLHEVGAGLQITPNGTRLLRRWGLSGALSPQAAVPSIFSILRFDGRTLALRSRYQDEIEKRYGTPIWCLHRVDLQKAMAERALELGVNLRLGTRIKAVDFDHAAVICEAGDRFEGDLVLAADGLWSSTRNLLMGRTLSPQPTGDLAYRILLQADKISEPDLLEWIVNPAIRIWIGPRTHAVGYSIQAGRLYNLVLLVPDDLPKDVAKQKGDLEEMRKLFEGWDTM